MKQQTQPTMKDSKNNPTKNTNTITPKKEQKIDLRSMSMGELLKLAKERNLPVKLDLNKEGLIKVLEGSQK